MASRRRRAGSTCLRRRRNDYRVLAWVGMVGAIGAIRACWPNYERRIGTDAGRIALAHGRPDNSRCSQRGSSAGLTGRLEALPYALRRKKAAKLWIAVRDQDANSTKNKDLRR